MALELVTSKFRARINIRALTDMNPSNSSSATKSLFPSPRRHSLKLIGGKTSTGCIVLSVDLKTALYEVSVVLRL